MKTQVDKKHYLSDKYASLGRFISYFYQINLIKKVEPKSILFIGVGDGVVPDYLRKNFGLQITTYDFDFSLNPDMVGDVRQMPFEKNRFDMVVAFEVLEHIPFEDFLKALGNLREITRKTVIISIPFRHMGFELILKFPFIRTILKKDFFRMTINIPLKFLGFEESGQHYWEIDRAKYKLKRLRSILSKQFNIVEELSPVLHSYQKFFVLEKKHEK